MKKSDELRKLINAKRQEVDDFQAQQEMDKAVKAADELDALVDELKLESAKEAADGAIANGAQGLRPAHAATAESRARLRNRAFNKLVLGGKLTDEERAAYFNEGEEPAAGGGDAGGDSTPAALVGQREGEGSKGGYIVPEEQLGILREYRKAYLALKDYCHVVAAKSNTGKYPTLGEESGLLVNFDELDTINESDFEFGQNSYTISDYGDIIPVSNQFIQDANVNILSIVAQRLARKAVNTENSAILTQLATLSPSSVSTYKGLTKALNVDLDPVYYANAKIFTNQDGFQWMSELEDGQNRPLMVPDVVAPDTYRFRGKPVIVVPNSILASADAANNKKDIPFYIGNLADYIMFFERAGVEIAVSKEYMFAKYATALRCVVRFGITADDTDAIKAYTVTA